MNILAILKPFLQILISKWRLCKVSHLFQSILKYGSTVGSSMGTAVSTFNWIYHTQFNHFIQLSHAHFYSFFLLSYFFFVVSFLFSSPPTTCATQNPQKSTSANFLLFCSDILYYMTYKKWKFNVRTLCVTVYCMCCFA